jgi:hypothetical protein
MSWHLALAGAPRASTWLWVLGVALAAGLVWRRSSSANRRRAAATTGPTSTRPSDEPDPDGNGGA